jgi:formate hydrogenlyase subunit 3/multisubunit Na+/H+ antiporter MnhD subunit
MYDFLALSPVILPVAGALIALALYRYYRKAFDAFLIAFTTLLFLMDVWYLFLLKGGMEPLSYGPITLDAPGIVITTLVSFLGMMIMLYSFAYKHKPQYNSVYFALYLLLMSFMSGLANTSNLVIMLILLEAATVVSGVLVLFGRTSRSIKAATIYLAISIFEVLLVLYGIFLLYRYSGSLDIMAGIGQIPDSDKFLLAVLFLFGFGTKAGIIPLGIIWLPPAHAEAPPPISATMSGILIATSAIAMIRAVYPFYLTSGLDTVMLVVVAFGVLNVLVGAIMALFQKDLKRMLACSSISQMGYVFTGLGLATTLGVYGGLFHIVNHMLFKGGLFLISGALILMVNTRQIPKMGGLLKQMPLTAICFLILALAMAGIPFMSGSVSKGAIEEATMDASHTWWGYEWFGYAELLGSVLTFIYLMYAFYMIFLRKPVGDVSKVTDPPKYMLIPILLMAVLCLLLGFFPDLISGILQFAADALLHAGA